MVGVVGADRVVGVVGSGGVRLGRAAGRSGDPRAAELGLSRACAAGLPSGVEGAYGGRSFDPICPAPPQSAPCGAFSPPAVVDRIEAVVLRIAIHGVDGRVPTRDSGRFRIRMSMTSTDHVVVPGNAEGAEGAPEAVEAVDASATTESPEAAEAPEAAPEPTFADLGLPEGVVRKLAQNGVTTPSRSRPRPSRTRWRARTSSAGAAPAPARPSPSVCRPWPRWPAAAPRSTSPAPSSSPRPASWPCRSPTRSSRTATSSA